MRLFISLSYEEIQNQIPYQIIAETTSCSVWGTGKTKRKLIEHFDEKDRKQIEKIVSQAHMWALKKGVPMEGIKMSFDTYVLWFRLAIFCEKL